MVLAILVVVSVSTYQNTFDLIETSRWVANTREFPVKLEEIITILKDAENARRIFTVTAKDRHLEPYYSALTSLNQKINNIRTLTADDPNQQQQFVKLNSLVAQRVSLLNKSIELIKSQGFDFDVQSSINDEGKQVMDAIRKTVSVMEIEENKVVNQQLDNTDANIRNMVFVLFSGIILSCLLLLVILYLLVLELTETARENEKISSGKQQVEQKIIEYTQQFESVKKELEMQIIATKQAEEKIGILQSELKQKADEYTMQLEAGQQELATQNASRKQVEDEIRKVQSTLKRQIIEHTAQLESAKEELTVQIAARKQAEGEIRKLQLELERKIMERSIQLESIQMELEMQITSRRQTEESRSKIQLELERKIVELTIQLESVNKDLAAQTEARKQVEAEMIQRRAELEIVNKKLDAQILARKQGEEELKHNLEQFRSTLEETVNSLASAIEQRYPYLTGHQQRVAQLAGAIAKEIDLLQEQIEGLRIAGLLHEIGNLNIPAGIISKFGPLNNVELNVMQTHPKVGYDILKSIEFPWPVAQIVLQHHERMNGSGYPSGLAGNDILLEARILAVADTVEAMVSRRTYRPALGLDKALSEISTNAETAYDKKVVEACIDLFTENRFTFTPL